MNKRHVPNVLIYTHSLMAPSMTFIRSHAEALQRHTAVYAGAHRVPGLALPADRTICVNEGGLGGIASELLFRQAGVAPRFIGRLKEMAPVVIHTHFGDSGPAGRTIARALGIPQVLTFHGRDATITDEESSRSWRGRAYLRMRKNLIADTDCVIAVSEFIKSRLLDQGFDERRIVVHYNGIDTDAFVPTDDGREALVLFVGRFVEKKGCRYLLEALARLKQSGQCVRAVLIGDGPLRSSLELFAHAEGLQVEFPGMLSLDEVKSWMSKAMIVVVPSVTAADGDSEGLPTVVLEAQAMSAAVVATRHSGIPEGVMDGESAQLVAERDVEGLAVAIRALINDPLRCRRMGEAGRKLVKERFSIAGQVAGLEDTYQCLRSKVRSK